jgi:hypothetical protein
MAKESVAAARPAEFFSSSATYLIHPDTDAKDLLDDAGAWLDSVKATVNHIAIELGDDGSQMHVNPRDAARMLWGVFHTLGMIEGAVQAARGRTKGVRS